MTIRTAIARYIRENFDDLLALDLKIARLLGIPAPHTLSSYAHVKGGFWERVIDRIFKWLFNEINHCYNDFLRVTNGSNR